MGGKPLWEENADALDKMLDGAKLVNGAAIPV